ncbi:uncharacterized protein LOC117336416 [Pecten maximus]|uniref:uncharacterized protein LOC117336416 n=1 Tax=Pecten maximus TaxID=6579 RepID=UPI0014590074|nr:uncharacterized protein LOC117336416 [Pecten maximus]
MAEGGLLQVPDTPRSVNDSHLLDCPVCLEQLHEPKSLPCLHSFCQECLSTFITKDLSGKMASATAFPCPVCRKMTSPVNLSEDRKKWAQQFPTNDLVKDLIKAMTREPLYCQPCEKKGDLGTPATTWCKAYNVLFCAACKVTHHDLIHGGCETVDVTGKEGIMQRQVTQQIRCEKHTKKICYYCEDHQVLGCSRCITIDHRRCNIVTTQEYCDKLKEHSRLEDLKTSLQKTTESIVLLIKEFGEDLQTLVNDQKNGSESLAHLRKMVDMRLDVMQKNISDKLISSYKEERENLEVSMQRCERLMSSIQNTIESSEAAVQRKDNVDTILLYQRGQAEEESYQNMLMEMKKSFNSVRIKHVVEPSLLRLDKDIPLSLGDVAVEKKLKMLPPGLYSNVTALSECCVKEVSKFSINCPSDGRNCSSSGVVYLPSDHIIVGDSTNRKIKLFTASGKYLDEMNVSAAPFDMCRVDDHTVAAAIPKFGILIIRVHHSTLNVSFKIKMSNCEQPYGITYSGDTDTFIVSTLKEIYRVSTDGYATYMCTYPSSCWHLVYDERTGHIYGDQYTSKNGHIAVYKLSDGVVKPKAVTKVGILRDAFGIDVDGDGNVYVCGLASNNVVQMSGDGKNVRELLRPSDGVHKPTAISVYGNKFVVTKESSYDRTEVHIFQLY